VRGWRPLLAKPVRPPLSPARVGNGAGRGCFVVVRGYPLGTVQDRCEWHSSGTASEDDPWTPWRRWLGLDRMVRPVVGGHRLVGKSPEGSRQSHTGTQFPTQRPGRCFPGLYHAFELGGRRSIVPLCTCSSRGVAARTVGNLVSIRASGPVLSRTPSVLRSSVDRDRSGWPGPSRILG
jgi:hypothetical protein